MQTTAKVKFLGEIPKDKSGNPLANKIQVKIDGQLLEFSPGEEKSGIDFKKAEHLCAIKRGLFKITGTSVSNEEKDALTKKVLACKTVKDLQGLQKELGMVVPE